MGTYCSYQKHLEDSTKSDNLAIMVSKQVSCVSVPVWDACSATPSSPCSISYHQSQLPSKVTMKHCMSNCKRLDPTGLAYTLMSYSSSYCHTLNLVFIWVTSAIILFYGQVLPVGWECGFHHVGNKGVLEILSQCACGQGVCVLSDTNIGGPRHFEDRMEQLKLAKGPAKNNNAKPPSPRGSHASSIKKNKDGKHEERPQQGFHVFSPVEA
ncbi:hypothetical protein JHK84_027716 [Glycine max]|nr:hypothetical protein JHK84_027716 [Glycine max]